MNNKDLKGKTVMIYVIRWFDKINGNSYFNYYIELPNGENIDAKYNIEYGYGTYPFYTAQEHLKELGYNNFRVKEIDCGYKLKREVKNFNK